MMSHEAAGDILALAETMARDAGELLLEHFGRLERADAERKGGRRRDLVSRADREAEALLVDRVPAADDVLAEEGEGRSTGGRRRWIMDPLDGTVNFLHGLPVWAVSIAVQESDRLVAGVVHAPALGQTFTAGAGEGARLNGDPIRVSRTRSLEEAILATGFAYNRNEHADDNLNNWNRFVLESAGVRRMGSAAIDMAFTACGRFDGFWELHLNPWDVAAGSLLVREAGGRVSDFHRREGLAEVLGSGHIVASNGPLHEEIVRRLAPLRELQ